MSQGERLRSRHGMREGQLQDRIGGLLKTGMGNLGPIFSAPAIEACARTIQSAAGAAACKCSAISVRQAL